MARYNADVVLDDSPDIQSRVLKSRQVIVGKVSGQKSVYGVSTGFGGSGQWTLGLIHAKAFANAVTVRS